MPAAVRQQQAYDHRLRLYVHDTGDLEAARQLGVPRSTAHGWRTRGCRPVVTLNDATESELAKLTRENELLKRRVAQLRAWLGIAIVILKLSRFTFERDRLPDGKDKAWLLRAINRGSKVAKLSAILNVLGLSPSRYHVWKNAKPCELSDASSCPRSHPLQATRCEVENYNGSVDAAIISLKLKRIFAQTEVTFSNSMIEAWWRVLKHQWLFLNKLDSLSKVTSLVAFYVDQHNRHLPHAAFKEQTPNEMYFRSGSDIPEQLSVAGQQARDARREVNLAASCNVCRKPSDVVPLSPTQPSTD